MKKPATKKTNIDNPTSEADRSNIDSYDSQVDKTDTANSNSQNNITSSNSQADKADTANSNNKASQGSRAKSNNKTTRNTPSSRTHKTSKKDEPYAEIKKPVTLLFGAQAATTASEALTPSQLNSAAEDKSAVIGSSETLPIAKIQLPASQPRRYFDPQKLEELSRSIKELGILEPLLVRTLPDGKYELVAGERRYKAAQLAGLTEVPVVIREMDDITTSKVQLVENLQREDLNPIEETEGILELLSIELGVSSNEIISILNSAANAKKRNLELTENVFRQLETVESILEGIGKFSAESFRVSRIPLLNLPGDILEALRQGKLEYTKARAIAQLRDEETRKQLLEDAIAYNLSLNEIKRKIKEIEQQSKSETPSIKDQVDDTFRRFKQSKVWDDPKKKIKVEKLLAQLDALMKNENTN